ncbi:DUF2442 domain-containing protein [Dethiosulfovibrio sp. F2B]|uniref:DUF2442 domain-containing protein n=1 Tax=Dethiosulfovibrio faecalis TaxID=2720018 RepID=UPI001F254751|nr:DUF2442 domain-containing protein [Dethiosulfovibrio faecalis]MCF4151723.1 DUF2442 domain-containing protein [Dethiosulfovibrio faecalis]
MNVDFIKSVMPLNDWRLFVEMETGSLMVVDLSHKLDTARFGDLRDFEFFRSVSTDGDIVLWGGGRVRLTARELMDVVFVDKKEDL